MNVIKEILESDDDIYLMVDDEKFSDAWILDSRFSFHMSHIGSTSIPIKHAMRVPFE